MIVRHQSQMRKLDDTSSVRYFSHEPIDQHQMYFHKIALGRLSNGGRPTHMTVSTARA
jgi:hypothetical protein